MKKMRCEDERKNILMSRRESAKTMGWRDYNQGNPSAFDGDLGPVEAKMRQERGRKIEDEVKTKRPWRYWGIIVKRAQRRFLETEEGKISGIIFHSIEIKYQSSAVLVCPNSQEEEVCSFIMRMQKNILFHLFLGATEDLRWRQTNTYNLTTMCRGGFEFHNNINYNSDEKRKEYDSYQLIKIMIKLKS